MAGRPRTKRPEAVVPTNAIVASAVRYPGSVPRIFHPSQPWQDECYRHYGICGEARYAANYMGNSLSRSTLYAADPATPAEIEASKVEAGDLIRAASDAQSSKILGELFGGPDGQAGMLKLVGIHMTVAGECYLVGRAPTGILERDRGADPKADTIWEIVSVTEMTSQGNRWVIKYGDGHPDVALADDDVVIRIWKPDPERRMEADSPFKSALPVLREIEYLTLHIFAQCRSRLAGAGILWVPSEMDFPPPPNNSDGEPMTISTPAEGLMLRLADAMVPDIHDQSDVNSTVPVALAAPGETIDKAKLMHFWSNLDEKALEMRSAAIHRFALSMDLPPEQILGMSSNSGAGGGNSNGVSHWGAWQIDESTIKLHIEPMLDSLVAALTISYLRPAGANNSVVLYDTSTLRLRPDRSKEALELYDRGLLKATVAIRENGFDPKDMPDDKEREQWLLMKIASGSATPDQVHVALKALGVDLGPAPSASGATQDPRESRPTPSLEGHETRREPEQRPDTPIQPPAAASVADELVLSVANAAVYRALERAGNRLRQSAVHPPKCPAYETHTLLTANGSTDHVLADGFSNANLLFEGIADYTEIVPLLQAYTRALVTAQVGHNKERLADWLRESGAVA